MTSIQTIKMDLQSIRYYYARKEMFEKAFDCVGKNSILETAQKYNSAICKADPKLYELYICLYINNNTQESAADELNYSVDYVAKHHKRLLKFFQSEFSIQS